MEPAPHVPPTKSSNAFLVSMFVLVGIGAVLQPILGWFDDTTELTPGHPAVASTCIAIAGVVAVLGIGLGIRQTRHLNTARRVVLPVLLGCLAFIVAFVVSDTAAEIVEGAIDFPRDATTSYATMLRISRAYQTHGKGQSWNIQTMPIWSNIDITHDDYDVMLAHRRPGDAGTNPDEISSQGYFCARVTMERSGDALRVLHAGRHALPSGSVIVCPQEDTTAHLQ